MGKNLMEFSISGQTSQIACKVSDFSGWDSFALACVHEYSCLFKKAIQESDVYISYVRYYPRGTEDSRSEFGNEGVYQFVDKKSRGAFEVYTVDVE